MCKMSPKGATVTDEQTGEEYHVRKRKNYFLYSTTVPIKQNPLYCVMHTYNIRI